MEYTSEFCIGNIQGTTTELLLKTNRIAGITSDIKINIWKVVILTK